MEEIWKDIIIVKRGKLFDYSGKYQVSNYGNVRSLRYRGQNGLVKKLKPGCDGRGYPYVVLTNHDGSQDNFKIHRLVATAFLPNPNDLPEVNHKDEVKTNNHVDNLEWCSSEYNLEYGTARERQANSKRENGKLKGASNGRARKIICLNTKQIFETIKDAEQWCGVSPTNCLLGENKTAGKHPETGEHLVWLYYEDYIEKTEEEIQKLIRERVEHSKTYRSVMNKKLKGKAVICLETQQVFQSIREANLWCTGDVGACCKGKQMAAGKHPKTGEKLHWMYYEDWLEQNK